MKRPLHVWSAFLVCLLLVSAGMGWLTVKLIELDKAEANATLQADFEGDVRLALHRMDKELTEIRATETAWPHYVYESFYWPVPGPSQVAAPEDSPTQKGGGGRGGNVSLDKSGGRGPPSSLAQSGNPQPVASPLLNPPNPYVNLYFQVDADNNVVSPNVPPADQESLAVLNGAIPQQIKKFQERLDDLQGIVQRNDLKVELPAMEPLANGPTKNTIQLSQTDSNQPPASAGEVPVENDENPSDEQLAQQLPQKGRGRWSKEGQTQRGNFEYFNRKRQSEQQLSNYGYRLQQQHAYAGNNVGDQTLMMTAASPAVGAATAMEGRSRAFWVDSQLLLARRVQLDGQPIVQGCWLNWSAIQQHLAAAVSDLLPNVRLKPVQSEADANMSRMLATLPAEVVVDPPLLDSWSFGKMAAPIRFALLAAWGCLLVAASAAWLLLSGVVALSERRAAFVSAVTHELRTPLTTFRMYAEMLAEGMVPDPIRRQSYLDTLKTEADRLYHLVENVLSYSQLERGRAHHADTDVSVHELIAGMSDRLAARASQADMTMDIDVEDSVGAHRLITDVGSVEQIVMNLVDNACKYASSATDPRIHLLVCVRDGKLRIEVRDHGPGIPRNEMRRLFLPFTKSARDAAHSAPGVGLGLALCRRLARQLGGKLQVQAPTGGGAAFVLSLTVTAASA